MNNLRDGRLMKTESHPLNCPCSDTNDVVFFSFISDVPPLIQKDEINH